jgi:hypothetical protein
LAISPDGWDGEAAGGVRDEAVSFLIALLSAAFGIGVDGASGWVAQGEPWFYQRLGVLEAGLVLFPVLREGLRFGECLGVTEGRANRPR